MNGDGSARSRLIRIAQRRARWASQLGAGYTTTPVRRRIKSLAERVAGSMGYAVIPRWRLHHYELAEHLKRLFGMLDVDCVLDVGANKGQYRDFLRACIGYTGAIISFEPISENVEFLTRRATADERWTIMPLALGEEDHAAEINVTASTDFSSFLKPKPTAHFDAADFNVVQRTELVQVRRLDSVLQEVMGSDPARKLFLKIDTQGYELPILNGARCSLDWILGLQAELSVLPLYHGITDYLDGLAYMRNLGFCVTGIFPVNRDRLLRVIDFDCVMRRKEAK